MKLILRRITECTFRYYKNKTEAFRKDEYRRASVRHQGKYQNILLGKEIQTNLCVTSCIWKEETKRTKTGKEKAWRSKVLQGRE